MHISIAMINTSAGHMRFGQRISGNTIGDCLKRRVFRKEHKERSNQKHPADHPCRRDVSNLVFQRLKAK